MKAIKLKEGIWWVGGLDWDLRNFHGYLTQRGSTYNAYLIIDEKITLIDNVKSYLFDEMIARISDIIDPSKIDILIQNHVEMDHSGGMPALMKLLPNASIYTNANCIKGLKAHYKQDWNFHEIKSGDSINIGSRDLSFLTTPMVHWPETMMSYDIQDKLLFTGDAFGGFGALSGGLFDDEVNVEYYEDETLRYYSNIVGKFSPMVQKAFAKLKGLDIKIIASTHGPVWRTNPGLIIEQYDRWSRYEAEDGVVLAYASMYGNTKKMAEAVSRGLVEGGIKEIRMHDVSRTHVSYMLKDCWRYKGIILGSVTYDVNPLITMKHLTDLLEAKHLKNRTLGIFGSYGWSGGAVKYLQGFAERTKWELVQPVVEAERRPSKDILDQCRQL